MKRIVVFALVLNAALLGVIAHQLVAIAGGGAVATQNGDTNGDGSRDITDAIYYLSWLCQGGQEWLLPLSHHTILQVCLHLYLRR